jgi:hypothetical protein
VTFAATFEAIDAIEILVAVCVVVGALVATLAAYRRSRRVDAPIEVTNNIDGHA